jgi:enoyl-CoA hydratase/carnithine racemase
LSYRFIRSGLVEPGIAAITLARPERLNALHGPLLEELRDAVERVERDPDVRVFLLTGAPRADGRPCFCAGADLKAAAEGLQADEHIGQALTNAIDDMLKPSIAVVDGVCSTGGVELALACDLRLVGESAQISDWHLKNLGTGLGGWGGSTRWARLVGVANAKRVILTGQVVDGPEALRIGFAQGLHASERLWDEALAMARSIAAMSPDGLRLTLAHYDHTMDMSRDASIRFADLFRKWFSAGGSFQERAREVLDRKTREQP